MMQWNLYTAKGNKIPKKIHFLFPFHCHKHALIAVFVVFKSHTPKRNYGRQSCLCNSSAPPSSVKYLPTYQSIKNQVKSGETPVVVKFTTNVYRSTGITIKFTRRKSNLLLGLRTNPKIGQLLGLLFQLTVSFKTRKTVTQLSEFLQKQNPQSHKTWDATRAGMEGSRTVVGCAITSRDLPYIQRICGCVQGVSPSGYSRLHTKP